MALIASIYNHGPRHETAQAVSFAIRLDAAVVAAAAAYAAADKTPKLVKAAKALDFVIDVPVGNKAAA